MVLMGVEEMGPTVMTAAADKGEKKNAGKKPSILGLKSLIILLVS